MIVKDGRYGGEQESALDIWADGLVKQQSWINMSSHARGTCVLLFPVVAAAQRDARPGDGTSGDSVRYG